MWRSYSRKCEDFHLIKVEKKDKRITLSIWKIMWVVWWSSLAWAEWRWNSTLKEIGRIIRSLFKHCMFHNHNGVSVWGIDCERCQFEYLASIDPASHPPRKRMTAVRPGPYQGLPSLEGRFYLTSPTQWATFTSFPWASM